MLGVAHGRCRFIPTCVGNIACRSIWHAIVSRFIPTCVGNIRRCISSNAVGSSPRAWGIHPTDRISASVRGSSPRAWGTLLSILRHRRSSPVHPHVRGEHRARRSCNDPCHRFIPTCVGNISALPWSICTVPVHPHVRGEHAAIADDRRHGSRFIPTCVGNMSLGAIALAVDAGSSPRVWGTCMIACRHASACPVHPHVCGEHRQRHRRQLTSDRFIPTCVGNMSSRDCRRCIDPVHPHVCGEHSHRTIVNDRRLPVHPHVCGEHRCQPASTASSCRFIPTCVGNIAAAS